MATMEHANNVTGDGRSITGGWKILRIIGWMGAAFCMLFPLVAMLFTNEVDWTFSDFLFAAVVLGGTGLIFEFALRRSEDDAYRTGIVLALAAMFLLAWSNAAVGFVGSGANPANILYVAMLTIPIVGSLVAGFRAKGMFFTMIATAIVQVSIAVFAFSAGLVAAEEKFVIGAINAIFIVLWIGSALLFYQATERTVTISGSSRNLQNSGIHLLLSILLIVIGAILAVLMITTESEPGAIPLLLVLLGMGWFFITLFRSRSNHSDK